MENRLNTHTSPVHRLGRVRRFLSELLVPLESERREEYLAAHIATEMGMTALLDETSPKDAVSQQVAELQFPTCLIVPGT